LIDSETETKRDIGAMSLKILLKEVPSTHSELSSVLKYVIPSLLTTIKKTQAVDVVEIITSIIDDYGKLLCTFPEAVSLLY
jgi:hypothetical protein